MLANALLFLNDALIQPYAAILLFRFHAVWLNAPMRNPIGEFVMALTDFIVLPLRRLIPKIRGLDTASLLLAFTVEFIYLSIMFEVSDAQGEAFPLVGLLAWTAVKLLKISIYLLIISLLIEAILSWVNRYTPLAPLLSAINGPFVQPLRRVIPLVGNVDLSTLVLLIICQLILIVPVSALEQFVMRLL